MFIVFAKTHLNFTIGRKGQNSMKMSISRFFSHISISRPIKQTNLAYNGEH